MNKLFLLSVFIVVFLFTGIVPVLAHHRAQVLGVATPSSEIVVAPITSGPGYILPDSPLYFLDHLKQSVRLLFAFGPAEKARVHADIAGERMAELRIMLARNNNSAAATVLTLLANEMAASAKMLTEAAASGAQVSSLAGQINSSLKEDQLWFSNIESQSNGLLKLQLQTARRALTEAKLEVDDQLSGDELVKETQEELQNEVKEKEQTVKDANQNLKNAQKALSEAKVKTPISTTSAAPVRNPTPTPVNSSY